MRYNSDRFLSSVLAAAGFRLGGGKKDHYQMSLTDSSSSPEGYTEFSAVVLYVHDAADVPAISAALTARGIAHSVTGSSVTIKNSDFGNIAKAAWRGQRQGFAL